MTMLSPSQIPTDYRGAYRSVAYLLRAFRRVAVEGCNEHRAKAFPRELTGAIEGEHSPGDTCSTWLTKLARRWDVTLSGDEEGLALRVYLPDGWASWEVVAARVPSALLTRIVEDADALTAFAMRFGPVPGRDDEAVEREIDEVILDVSAPTLVSEPWEPPPADGIEPRRWRALWRVEGPFAHGADEKTSNVVGVRRLPSLDLLTGETSEVPGYAGNAVRGLARRVLMGDLAQRVGFDWGAVRIPIAHSMLDGGTMEGSSQSVDADMRRRLRALLPCLDLFGTNWCRTDTMGGWLQMEWAKLVCRETAGELASWLAPGIDPHAWAAQLMPARELVTQIQLTSQTEELHDPATKVLARMEVVKPGTLFAHALSLDGRAGYGEAPEVVMSCAAHMLDLMALRGRVGAATARGCGTVRMDRYTPTATARALPSPEIYLAHVERHREAILDTLLAERSIPRITVPVGAVTVASPKPVTEKPTKGKARGKAATAAPQEILFGEGDAP